MSISRIKATCIAVSFLLLSVPAHATLITFDVFAQANSSTGGSGLNTGLTYAAGESITGFVDPNDLWSAGSLPRWSNADGLTQTLFATGSDESGFPMGTQIGADFIDWTQNGLTAPFGSLVGAINGTFFLLGTSFDVMAPDMGTLLLYYWDSNSGDNQEFVTVSINDNSDDMDDMQNVPEAAPIAMIGLGLFGIAIASRRRVKY